MLPSARNKRLLTESASRGNVMPHTKRKKPLVKPNSREEKSKLKLEMSKSVSRRKRDKRRLVKQKKLARLSRLPSD